MSLLELLICLSITAALIGVTASSSAAIIHHAQHQASVARLAQRIQSEYTTSSWQLTPRLFTSSAEVNTTPKLIRFNQGESTTPSSIQINDAFQHTLLTLSIRGNLSLKSTVSFGE